MIAIGSDHAAFEFKEAIKAWLAEKGYQLRDFGTCGNERVDYCDFGFRVGEAVASGVCEKGLVFCGTGVGISISANKVRGIRAVVCSEPYSARLSREHNDTNILALGARVVGIELAKMIIEAWLDARFEGGRHQERIDKIARYEARN
ncbi:MAG TPA: ribose 5-phosphate isomerase B [Terracidiphilus sp.]|nr:ribose 5-phosphate isomerase B [Terracidiphilus sp.]